MSVCTSIVLALIVDNESKRKPTPRPGRTKFLASVLTILSKATTATQFPEIGDPCVKHTKRREKKSKKRKENDKILDATSKKSKQVSKLLHLEDDLLDLLQTKNKPEIVYSSVEELPMTKHCNSEIFKNLVNGPVHAVCDQKTDSIKKANNETKNDKLRLLEDVNNEPTTLVAEQYKKDEKNVYSFFVDILQSTLKEVNKDNEETTEKVSVPNETTSKLCFEMEECVANTLAIKKPVETKSSKKPPEINVHPSVKLELDDGDFLYPNETENIGYKSFNNAAIPIYYKSTKPYKKQKLKLRPLRKRETPFRKSKSYENNNSARNRKKDLFNLLKEELSMDDYNFEEPDNFYQALKIMSKNKRRSERAVRFEKARSFEEPVENYDDIFTKKTYVLNRNKTRKPRANDVSARVSTNSGLHNKFNLQKRSNLKEVDSHLSIEVQSYNFVNRPLKTEDLYTYSELSLLGGSSDDSIDDMKYTPQWEMGESYIAENT